MKLRRTTIVVALCAVATSLATAAVAMAGTFIGTDAPERLIGTPYADTMDSKGGAYYPQLEQNNPRGGKVSWTLDPDANPNGG